jgi:phosphoethanolamine N-methyltransferase
MADDEQAPGYADEEIARLELLWGEGFLSPGGPAEVARIVGSHDIAGCSILDIGSGPGGADLALVRDHGAATVVGIDFQPEFVDLANTRAAGAGLAERVTYQLTKPGPLAFADGAFDVVFSKDAILHEPDKAALYAEVFRVLRPGGHLLVGDWLRAEGDELDEQVAAFVERAGGDFTMVSLQDIREIVERIGFTDVETEDRRAWYLGEVTAELDQLRGDMRSQLIERFGKQTADDAITFWEILVASVTTGALSPGHIRARIPRD